MTAADSVVLIVPEGIDDPQRPSGGNTYDRSLRAALEAAGWSVVTREVTGTWPHPDTRSLAALADCLGRLPDGSLVLVDGLVASAAPGVLGPESRRLGLVVLVHMPLGAASGEAGVLRAAAAVVTTSGWTRRWLLDAYGLDPGRTSVARPGVAVCEPAVGTLDGGMLLCVAAVTEAKGHDLLVTALSQVIDLPWTCRCVGPLDRDPGFVATLRARLRQRGLEDRVLITGPRTGAALDTAYAEADLLVLPSRAETYGMVVTEALARGVPVVATDVGGVPEALGTAQDGTAPGLLVPPEDPGALAGALRRWLSDADLRAVLRTAAARRRTGLAGWPETAAQVARVLAQVGTQGVATRG